MRNNLNKKNLFPLNLLRLHAHVCNSRAQYKNSFQERTVLGLVVLVLKDMNCLICFYQISYLTNIHCMYNYTIEEHKKMYRQNNINNN